MLDWLNSNSGAISAILTFVLTVATAIYVLLTRRLLRESVTVREASARPSVAIRLAIQKEHITLLNLVIENFGNGPALDLKLTVAQTCQERSGVQDLSKIGLFRNGMRYLAPHERVETFAANAIHNLDMLKQQPWTIDITYHDAAGKRYSDTFSLDFAEFEGITRVGESALEKIAASLEKIKSDFAWLLMGSKKLPVRIYTVQDEHDEGRVSELFYKLHELSPEGWAAVEAFVDEHSQVTHRADAAPTQAASVAPTSNENEE